MINPYDILGVSPDADESRVKAAYRRGAKAAHPDSGGDADTFSRINTAYELLRDPVRRRIYDETGYDPELADVSELEGLLVLEKFVNEFILDEREPGSFDPVAVMRAKLVEEIRKARFHIKEMERHRTRISRHLDRIGNRPATDVLGSMLRARSGAIVSAMDRTQRQIDAIEQACGMLDGYSYAVETEADAAE